MGTLRKNILFTPLTEYHFLLTLNIIQEHFLHENYQIRVLLIDHGNNRLSGVTTSQIHHNILLSSLSVTYGREVRKGLHEVLRARYDRLFIFHEFDVVTSFVKSKMVRDCTVALVEDGTAMYQKIKKMALFSRLRQTLDNVKHAWAMGILNPEMRFVSNVHGQSRGLKEVWLTNKKLFSTTLPKGVEVKAITILDNTDKVDFVRSYFTTAYEQDIPPRSLLYIGRVSFGDEYLENEIKYLVEYYGNSNLDHLFIKPHPLSTKKQISAYENIQGAVVLKWMLPVELIIAGLKESEVMAMDSTSLFYFNGACSYKVLYAYFQRLGLYPGWRHITFPDHVQFVMVN